MTSLALNPLRGRLGLLLAMAIASMTTQCAVAATERPIGVATRNPTTTIKHVAIDLRFDWKAKQAYGSTAITLSPLQPTREVTLDAGKLTIHSVTLANGKPIAFRYDGGDRDDGLVIALDRLVRPNETLTLKIAYRTNWANASDPNSLSGSDGKGLRFLEPTAADPRRRRQIWSSGTPNSSRYWFPGYDAPNALRSIEIRATVERPLSVVASGTRVSVKDNADGTRTFHYRATQPHASHRTLLAVGEYADLPQRHDGTALHNHGYPDEQHGVAPSTARLPDTLHFMSELTGTRLPHASYAQVFVQDLPWGQTGAGIALQTEYMIDDAGTHDDFLCLWNRLQGESAAQQWFGNHLSIADWRHAWLERRLSHYLDCLYDEHTNGRDEMLLWCIAADHATALADDKDDTRVPLVPARLDDAADFVMGNVPYARAAAVLHMLRKEFGDATWRAALRHYVRHHGGRLVTTADFQRSVEAAAGRSMAWFFEQWVDRTGQPVFEVIQQYDAQAARLTLYVKQTQQDFYQGSQDIDIDGRIERVWLEPKAQNTFSIAVAVAPRLVGFDHEGTWLKELSFAKTVPELLHQLRSTRDTLGRQWTMGELARIAKDVRTPDAVKQSIYAALRDVIAAPAYWRVRFNALQQLRNLVAPATQTQPVPLDAATTALLATLIREEKTWLRAAAVAFLGMTRDARYADLYANHLNDRSDRVINVAAAALDKTRSPLAFDVLARLPSHPSWKNQSLISALNGLQELGDSRGADIAFKALSDLHSARCTLATPVWDYRLAAADTLSSLGQSARGHELVAGRFQRALADNELHGVFSSLQLMVALGDARTRATFPVLNLRLGSDANAMKAIEDFENQLNDKLKVR